MSREDIGEDIAAEVFGRLDLAPVENPGAGNTAEIGAQALGALSSQITRKVDCHVPCKVTFSSFLKNLLPRARKFTANSVNNGFNFYSPFKEGQRG